MLTLEVGGGGEDIRVGVRRGGVRRDLRKRMRAAMTMARRRREAARRRREGREPWRDGWVGVGRAAWVGVGRAGWVGVGRAGWVGVGGPSPPGQFLGPEM